MSDFTGFDVAKAYYNQLTCAQPSPLSKNHMFVHCTFMNGYGCDINLEIGVDTFKIIKESIQSVVESCSGKTNLEDIHIYIVDKDEEDGHETDFHKLHERRKNLYLKTTELMLADDDIYISRDLYRFDDDIDDETLEIIRDEHRRLRIIVELTGIAEYPH